ncbi:RNA polymerase sigma factor [bacterium 0.1xD8-71]|nr:RNA polymerase sigma factor [bacterium 0.1xD8-71]
MYSDLGLIRKMKQGDEDAFAVFVHKYYPKVLLYCQYHCMDKEDARDLTQETFVRFFTKLPEYHYRGKNLNFLYTIAGNLCKDCLRKRKEIPLQESRLEKERLPEERQMENVLNKIVVQQALGQLPEELKEIIILYYFQGLKLTEIAETLHIGLPLVKYRLQRAKKQLEKWL